MTRVTFKRTLRVKCCTCNTRLTQLGRAYGGWPLAGWNEDFTETEQQAFYLSIGPCTSMQEIKKKTEKIFLKIYERKKSANRHSEEQPLSVWATRGYNIDDIKANTLPEDIVQHPVLKELYRIHLDTKDDTTVEGQIAKNVMSAKESRVPRRTPKRKSAAPALAEGKASQSSAVEGETVDAEAVEEKMLRRRRRRQAIPPQKAAPPHPRKRKRRSTRRQRRAAMPRRRRKKSKKDKKDRRPKETDKERNEREKREAKDRKERKREEEKRRLQELKDEKEREKEEMKKERQEQAALAKEAATNRSTANSLIGPLSSTLAVLDSCVNHKRMKDVPGAIAENVKNLKKELESWHHACTKSLGNGTPVGGDEGLILSAARLFSK